MKNHKTKKRNIAIFHKVFPRHKIGRKKDGGFFREEISPVSFDDIRTSFLKLGLIPTFSTFEDKTKKQLNNFGIKFDSSLFKGGDTQTEIFLGKHTLVIVEKVSDFSSILLQVAFCYDTEKKYQEILNAVKRLRNFGALKDGTYFESAMKQKLDEVLRNDSPNGKVIKEPKLKKIFSITEENNKRRVIKQVAKNLGQTARSDIKKSILGELSNNEDKKIAEDLLNNSLLFTKQYRLQCGDCDWISNDLTYKNLNDAQSVIKKGRYVCSRRNCRSNKVVPVEVFSVKTDTVRCLGGVWLEKYFDDILRKRVKYTWPGKMNGDDELDNVFVFSEKIFLVECKDTSFGMSDLYSIMIKAKNVEADEILVLATQGISKNVTDKVKELNEDGEYNISLMSGIQDEIEKKLDGLLAEKQNTFFEQILTGSRSRRPLRLPHVIKGL